MATKYDAIWYWTGGREVGEWRRAYPDVENRTLEEARATIRRAGYVCHLGTKAVGPPEGPPGDAEFRALGL